MQRTLAARATRPAALRPALPRPRALARALAGSATMLLRAPRRLHPRAPLALAVLGACALLLAGAWTFLRHSSLVAVRDVRISGVSGAQSASIEEALAGAARNMSTLDVNVAALRAAVAPFPVVASVTASARFPHGLRIQVSERPPVAALVIGGTRTAVAADGTILGPALLRGSLPSLAAARLPVAGRRVSSPQLLSCLAILGAAPVALRAHVATADTGARGVTVTMGNGLIVYFGDGSLARAKWLALARVLADPSSSGAGYVDVRLPSRPAAGFAAGYGPPAGTAQAPSAASQPGSESAVSSIAAGLAPPGTSTSASSSPTSTQAAPAPSETPQAGAAGGAEAAGGGGETQSEAGGTTPSEGG